MRMSEKYKGLRQPSDRQPYIVAEMKASALAGGLIINKLITLRDGSTGLRIFAYLYYLKQATTC